MRVLGIEVADVKQGFVEVVHQPLDAIVRRRLRPVFECFFAGKAEVGEKDRHRLSEVEDGEILCGRDADDEIATINILPSHASGLTPEDECSVREAAIGKGLGCLRRCE